MRHDFGPAAILDGPTFRSDTIDLYWKNGSLIEKCLFMLVDRNELLFLVKTML